MIFSSSFRTAIYIALLMSPVFPAQAGFEFIPGGGSNTAPQAMPQAPSAGTMMTPAPAANVVSEALTSAQAQTAPQSILPPAAAGGLNAYQPQPAPPVAMPSGMPVAAAPVINMNPMSGGQVQGSDGMQVGKLEQAMTQPPVVHNPANYNTISTAQVLSTPPSSGRGALGGLPFPPSAPVQQAATYPDAVGFGKDLPLALAVSQIVPPDYAFTFDNSVNPGDPVSWEGGRPWDQVLNQTLSKIRATARIDEAKKEITVLSAATQAAASAPPPAEMQVPRTPFAPAPAAAYTAPMTPPPAAMQPVAMAHDVTTVAAVPAMMGGTVNPGQQVQLIGLNPAVLDVKAIRLWEAPRGSTLRGIITDWSMQAGVELFWSSDFDYPVESSIRIKGTFEEAIQTLLSGFRDAQPRPIGRLHPNLPEGPSVLVIETKHMIE